MVKAFVLACQLDYTAFKKDFDGFNEPILCLW
jgi:hypothetical protein